MKFLNKLFSIALFFLLCTTNSFASKGCLSMDNKIYTVLTGEYNGQGNSYYYGVGSSAVVYEVCGPKHSSGIGVSYIESNVNCYINFSYGNIGNYNLGYEVNYTVVNCPIDDYIPAVVMAIAGVGFLLIRREKLLF